MASSTLHDQRARLGALFFAAFGGGALSVDRRLKKEF